MITSEEPEVKATSRYSIAQTCALLGVHRNSLRKYTVAGLIHCGVRGNSTKFYTGTEIKRFWLSKL